MQDLATHPLMTKARDGYIARYVDQARRESCECLGVSELGDFIYNRTGRIVSKEAHEGAAYVFDKVLRGFIAEAARFVPGRLHHGYVCESALEWANDNYVSGTTDEEIDASEVISEVVAQILKSTEREAA